LKRLDGASVALEKPIAIQSAAGFCSGLPLSLAMKRRSKEINSWEKSGILCSYARDRNKLNHRQCGCHFIDEKSSLPSATPKDDEFFLLIN
jgi:hypothetical protein